MNAEEDTVDWVSWVYTTLSLYLVNTTVSTVHVSLAHTAYDSGALADKVHSFSDIDSPLNSIMVPVGG